MKNQKMVLVENCRDPACPVQALTLLRMSCPPEQKLVFCVGANNTQKMQYIFNSQNFKSNPKVGVGGNYMAKWCKMFLCLVGCKGWRSITNHLICGGMCTIINISDISVCLMLLFFTCFHLIFF